MKAKNRQDNFEPPNLLANLIRSYGALKNLTSLTQIAGYLGYPTCTFTRKVRDGTFTRMELGQLVRKLEFRDEDIVRAVKG